MSLIVVLGTETGWEAVVRRLGRLSIISHPRVQFVPVFGADNAVATATRAGREGLQTNETLLLRPDLSGAYARRLGGVEPLQGWSRGRVSGAAAAALVAGLVLRVIHKAVGARLAAVLDSHSQLCGVQSSVNAIHDHAQDVRVYMGKGGGGGEKRSRFRLNFASAPPLEKRWCS